MRNLKIGRYQNKEFAIRTHFLPKMFAYQKYICYFCTKIAV